MAPAEPGFTALGVIAGYNVIQNVLVSERAYVPANLAVTVGLVGYARRRGVSLDEMGLGIDGLHRGLATGTLVACGVAAGTIAAGSSARLGRLFKDERARGHGRGEAVYRSSVRFPLGTALFEEVAFRGVLDALWRRRGPWSARIVSAVAFGAWHLLPTYREYPGMAPGRERPVSVSERRIAALGGAVITAVAGFGFTALREVSGSVVAPWLSHAAYNTFGYLTARRAWRRSGEGAGGSVGHGRSGERRR